MMEEYNERPKRKTTRLKYYDYSSSGAHFVTICVKDRKRLLSEIVKLSNESAVGEGLAPPAYEVRLKPCGEIAKEQLTLLENRFPSVTIEEFVIMPDHIHVIIFLHKTAGGASPSPTLDDVVCAFKSLTSRICKQKYGVDKIFQRSSAEHKIRDQEDFLTRKKYMYDNPKNWYREKSNN